MLDFERGRYLDAERDLTDVIPALHDSSEPTAAYELGRALVDRATVRRVLNRWSDAGADLDACEALLPSLGRMASTSLRTNIDLMRAQLSLTPQAPQHDPSGDGPTFDSTPADAWWVREAAANRAYRTGAWEEAATAYAEISTILDGEGWAQGAAAAALRAGVSLLELDRLSEAESWLQRAVGFFAAVGPPDLHADAERHMARLRSGEGSFDEAWEHARASLAILETSFRSFRSLHDEQRFLADKGAYYQHLFAVALGDGGAEGVWRAVEVAERSKSFYLCQLLANADIPLFDGVDAADVARLRALESRLDDLQAARAHDRRGEHDAEYLAVVTDRDELFARIMREHPRWAAAQTPPSFDPQRALDALPTGWSALSLFWLGDLELHMFLLRAGEAPYHRHGRWTAAQLEQLRSSQSTLHAASDSDLFFHGPVIPAELRRLILPADVLERLPPGERLLVSPHGPLRGVPVHAAAPRPTGPSGGPSVQYLPSLAMLALQRTASDATGVLLLGCERDGFGDPPLTGVVDELERLADDWAGSPDVPVDLCLLDPEAVVDIETAAAWGKYHVLQVACHGEFEPDRPLDAALRLGRSALRMSELFGLRLRAELVCLSACDLGGLGTRLADVEATGDEWLGLTMPLLYAGARTTLVSLWKANDAATARLMPQLHAGVRDGAEAADALQSALSTVADEDDVYWANWYLVGFPREPAPTPTPEEAPR
jgi:tetratricopeptide (TPR) repeat protein